jgi:hypothetical protein
MAEEKPTTLSGLRKQLSNLLLAKSSGYNVPQLMLDMVQQEIYRKEGVKEVWECSQCSAQHHLMFHAKEVSCKCGKIQRVWKDAIPA